MSATPIPRTLSMSLVGIRDMSIIETPPKDRLSIQTNVVKFDQEVIRRAIQSELVRGGQVYFVHNRVESIFSIGNLIQRLVPEVRLVIGHGQMEEDSLERAMLDFVARKYDVLLATTIVEYGFDLLGGEQSGHIEVIGFEMYMKLLEETVRELKGEEIDDDVRATVNLGVDLRIDESYVADMNQRLMLYRKVAAARREDEIVRILDE